MAGSGQEGGRVLGLGEQGEAGRGDGEALTQPCNTGARCRLPGWVKGPGQMRSPGTWWQKGVPVGERGADEQRCGSKPKVQLFVPFAHFQLSCQCLNDSFEKRSSFTR